MNLTFKRQATRREIARKFRNMNCVFQGSYAFSYGMTPIDCRYVLGTPEQRAWYNGWSMAYDKKFPTS
jgi:hypothetical protein